MEGKLYELARAAAPSVVNVHVPVSGRRFHAYLQLKDPAPGEAREAIAAALGYRRVKAAFAVDSDIDIFSDSEMLWAVATRVQWHATRLSWTGCPDPRWIHPGPPGRTRFPRWASTPRFHPPRHGNSRGRSRRAYPYRRGRSTGHASCLAAKTTKPGRASDAGKADRHFRNTASQG